MKVLIVEDKLEDRKILRYYLDQFKCDIVEAADGAEGFEAAMRERPGLIISDALMPGVDGFHLLRNVRNCAGLDDTPFVFYSAIYAGERDREFALSLGADAFIVKPKEPEEFLRELKGVLQGLRPGKRAVRTELLKDEEAFQREYSHIVAARLGNKVRELERAKSEDEEGEKT